MNGERGYDPRFQAVAARYFGWKGELEAGRMSHVQFEQALEEAAIEHEGRWWMLGANSGRWYVSDGDGWREATPPSIAQSARMAPPPVQTGSGPRASAAPAPSAARSPSAGAGGWTVLLLLTSLLAGSGFLLLTGRAFFLGMLGCVVAVGLLSIDLMHARRIPPWLFFGGATVWTLAGFVALETNAGGGRFFWRWPDLVWDLGLAALIGGVLGWVWHRLATTRGSRHRAG